MSALERILSQKIVAVIRADDGDQLIDVGNALAAGGVHIMEITFTVPAAHQVLEKVSDALRDRMLIGAGTVLDEPTARLAILAGAQFVVGPNTNRSVIKCCRRYGVPVMPGALTPTEVVTAWEAGADVVKVFPSDTLGPKYLKALRGPLPQIPLMPTGGVNLQTASDFLTAGAVALGVGGSLASASAINRGDFESITENAKAFVSIVEHHSASSDDAR